MGTPPLLNCSGGEPPAGAARLVTEKLKTFGGVPIPPNRPERHFFCWEPPLAGLAAAAAVRVSALGALLGHAGLAGQVGGRGADLPDDVEVAVLAAGA